MTTPNVNTGRRHIVEDPEGTIMVQGDDLLGIPTRAERPIVIIVRDPDASNEVTVYGGDVEIHDVDLGYADLDDPDEFREWAALHLAWVIVTQERAIDPNRYDAHAISAGDDVAAIVSEVRRQRHGDGSRTPIAWDELWRLAERYVDGK